MIPEINFDRTGKEIPRKIQEAVAALSQGHIAWQGDTPVVMKGARKVALLDPPDLADPTATIKQLQHIWPGY